MDAQRFDAFTKTLSNTGSGRGIVRLLSALPLGVTLAAFHGETPEATAQDDDHGSSHRRHRRKAKQRHRPGQDKEHGKDTDKRKGKKTCTSKSKAKTCARKCGTVKNTCGKRID